MSVSAKKQLLNAAIFLRQLKEEWEGNSILVVLLMSCGLINR